MHLLLVIAVVAIFVVAAWTYVSSVTRRYDGVSIWPM